MTLSNKHRAILDLTLSSARPSNEIVGPLERGLSGKATSADHEYMIDLVAREPQWAERNEAIEALFDHADPPADPPAPPAASVSPKKDAVSIRPPEPEPKKK